MARDLGKLEDDMGSIEALRGKRGAAKAPRMVPPVAPKRRMADPADAGIFTADKGIQPPSPDEGPTLDRGMAPMPPVRPQGPRQMKAAGDIRAALGMKKGGKVGSASKRADGIATKGKTKGRFV